MKPGKYSKTYTQFDTIRQLRTTLSNYHVVDSYFDNIPYGIASESGMLMRFASGTASSVWLERFIQGYRRWLGQDWRPDRALSIKLVLATLKAGQEVIEKDKSPERVVDVITFCAYMVIGYVLSLRGPEGLLLDLGALIEQDGLSSLQTEGNTLNKTVLIIPLLRKVKGETHSREHVLPCVEETSSGILVRKWMDLLIEVRALKGQTTGPAITKWDGALFTTPDLNTIFHGLLWDIFQKDKSLFGADIKTKADIEKWFSVFRTLRRTSDSRSLAEAVSPDDINAINRWSEKERAKGRKVPGKRLRHYYADMPQLLSAFVRYTYSM